MTRLVALLTAVAFVAAGCSDAGSGSLGPAPTGAPPTIAATQPGGAATRPGGAATSSPPGGSAVTQPPGSAGTTPVPATVTVQLWFVRAGKLVPTLRTRPATVATSRLALTELAAGPSPAETAAGMATGIPAGIGFDIVGIANGVETLDLAPAFYTGGADAVRLRRAQVVYSLTQFPTVSKVGFRSGGEPRDGPAGRGEYADLLPPIVVTGPGPGERLSSPVTVAGTADVFEATVNVRVLDSAGHEIATAFTTATCGTGCRGDFSVAVSYRLGTGGPGTVEVYEVSPRDGTRVNVVAIPVALIASGG